MCYRVYGGRCCSVLSVGSVGCRQLKLSMLGCLPTSSYRSASAKWFAPFLFRAGCPHGFDRSCHPWFSSAFWTQFAWLRLSVWLQSSCHYRTNSSRPGTPSAASSFPQPRCSSGLFTEGQSDHRATLGVLRRVS